MGCTPLDLGSWQVWTCSSVLFHVLFQLVLVGLCEGFSNLQYFSLFHHVLVITPLANSLILQISGISLHRFDKGIISLAAGAKCNLCKFNKKYLEYEETKQLMNSCSGGMSISTCLSLFLSPFLLALSSVSSFLTLPSLPASLHLHINHSHHDPLLYFEQIRR